MCREDSRIGKSIAWIELDRKFLSTLMPSSGECVEGRVSKPLSRFSREREGPAKREGEGLYR
jgi:hypothetical protein